MSYNIWQELIHIIAYPQAIMVMREWCQTKIHGVPYHYNTHLNKLMAGYDGSWPSAESLGGLPAQGLGAVSQWQAPCQHTWIRRSTRALYSLWPWYTTHYFLEEYSVRLGRGCVWVLWKLRVLTRGNVVIMVWVSVTTTTRRLAFPLVFSAKSRGKNSFCKLRNMR